MRKRTDAEVGGQRLPEVGKRPARAEIDAGTHTAARSAESARTRASDRCSASSDRCRDRR